MIIVQSQLLQIPTTAQPGEKIYFKQDPRISGAILKGIQIPDRTVDVSTNFRYYNQLLGFNLIGGTKASPFFITLVNYKGEELHKNLVPHSFISSRNKGKLFTHFNNNIDLKKCYIQFNQTPYSFFPATQRGILFNFILKTLD